MAIEFHFYLLYPIVLWGFKKLGVWQMFGCSLLLSVCTTLAVLEFGGGRSDRVVLDSILVRWPEWIAGGVLAELYWNLGKGERGITRSSMVWVIGLTAMGAAALIQILYQLQLNVLWTAGLFVFMAHYLFHERIGESPIEIFLKKIGLFSFSVYLIHYPILRICAILMDPDPLYLLTHLGIYALVLPGILALGYLFFQVFEKPVLFSRRA